MGSGVLLALTEQGRRADWDRPTGRREQAWMICWFSSISGENSFVITTGKYKNCNYIPLSTPDVELWSSAAASAGEILAKEGSKNVSERKGNISLTPKARFLLRQEQKDCLKTLWDVAHESRNHRAYLGTHSTAGWMTELNRPPRRDGRTWLWHQPMTDGDPREREWVTYTTASTLLDQ